jgi:Secretion system C-terminal sorting domain
VVFVFKNKYVVGDSFSLRTEYVNSTVYIDSVIALNGIKRYASRIKCRAISGLNSEFIKRFNIYDKFIPDQHWYVHGMCTAGYYDGLNYTPLCYTDRVSNYKSVHYTGSCDTIARFDLTNGINPDVKIYPNPADSYLVITSDLTQMVTLNIKNMNGVVVIQQKFLIHNNVDTRNLPNGMYILTVQSENGFSTTQKLVVHH